MNLAQIVKEKGKEIVTYHYSRDLFCDETTRDETWVYINGRHIDSYNKYVVDLGVLALVDGKEPVALEVEEIEHKKDYFRTVVRKYLLLLRPAKVTLRCSHYFKTMYSRPKEETWEEEIEVPIAPQEIIEYVKSKIQL